MTGGTSSSQSNDWLMLGICAAAAVATFYGGFTVTVACGISPQVAWIWPVISDGLAYKAFRSIAHIHTKSGRFYAWCVTGVFAAQSGLAQGVDGVVGHSHDVTLPWQIRAAVNGMPAAAALAAGTLHWLVMRPTSSVVVRVVGASVDAADGVTSQGHANQPGSPVPSAPAGLHSDGTGALSGASVPSDLDGVAVPAAPADREGSPLAPAPPGRTPASETDAPAVGRRPLPGRPRIVAASAPDRPRVSAPAGAPGSALGRTDEDLASALRPHLECTSKCSAKCTPECTSARRVASALHVSQDRARRVLDLARSAPGSAVHSAPPGAPGVRS